MTDDPDPGAQAPQGEDFSYDLFPYESYPFSQSHPENLYCLGRLMGMRPTLPKNCRVLELGCAEGGNLLPSALDNPDSEFVGIDLSERQIDVANTHKAGLGLRNISFRVADIQTFGQNEGKFDYILAHGVFSWVKDSTRKKVLEIMRALLTNTGIGYLSYNTMPGWSGYKTVRDMMLLHGQGAEDYSDKVRRAKNLIAFLDKFLPESDLLHPAVKKIMAAIDSEHETYFIHEYLDEDNRPFYFTEFNDMLVAHGLRYLGDTDLITMYTRNVPGEAGTFLEQIQSNIQQEQYMDFLRSRRFRQSFFCAQNATVSSGFSPERIADLCFTTSLSLRTADPDISQSVSYAHMGKPDFTISDPLLNAVLLSLLRNGRMPLSLSELTSAVCRKLGNADAGMIQQYLNAQMFVLMFKKLVEPKSCRVPSVCTVSEMPKAYALARYQAKQKEMRWATNTDHNVVKTTPDLKEALLLCDGQTPKSEILSALTVQKDAAQILQELAQNKLLVA